VTFVIDSSALIAFVQQEVGGDRVAAEIDGGVVSAVIFAECLSKLAERGLDPNQLTSRFLAAGMLIAPVGMDDIPTVVALHKLSKSGISLADRFCLALALDRGLPTMTADRPWAGLGLPLEIELIR
jgi:ribonuclease VapC